tara:strand:+ start:2069 stop:2815 length:747 start_codon:yes stop_codon:yes gene_type:complete
LEYAWFGPQGGGLLPLVLLHEGLGSVGMWGDFPTRLNAATGLPLFAYSRLGYGGSDSLPNGFEVDYMHREAFEVLPAVLEAQSIERAILVGHSDGASIAVLYAGGISEHRAAGLVLEAPHVFVEDISVKGIEGARGGYQKGRLRAALKRYHGANTDDVFWAWNNIWLDPAFRSWSIESYLPPINVPVQVIQGRDDAYGTLAQVDMVEACCAGPVEKIVLDDCGHAPHRDQGEAVVEAVARFVRDSVPA